MRTEVLEYFIKTLDCGSINRAARELFIAQSSLSEALTSLEKDLRCKLFERSMKGIFPTENGSKVYKDAQEIIRIIERWEMFSCADSDFSGNYNILATYAMCSNLLKDLIIEMKNAYPKLNLILHETRAQTLLHSFEKDKYNIAFGFYLPEEEKEIDNFIKNHDWKKEVLYDDDFCIVISSKNKLVEKEYLEKDLKNLVWPNM